MATVYERRRALAKSLRDDLPSNVRVVSNPDHPFLLRAADILVSSNGTLTAIFTPSSEEQRRPSLLTTRLTLNRLALPPHTKTVLIVESTDQSYFGDLAQEFSEVVEYSRRHTLAGLIIRADLKGRDIPREIVAAAKLRFVDAMQGSILVRRRRFGRFPELGRILINDSQILEKVIQGSERSLGDGALRSDRV